MIGGDPDSDEPSCGCGTYRECAYHAAQSAARAKAEDDAFKRRGVNPYAEVGGELAGLWLRISASTDLSQNQKDAIERIIWPWPPGSR